MKVAANQTENPNSIQAMKTKLTLLAAALTLVGGALAADPAARLSAPSSKAAPALAHKTAQGCQSMLVSNSPKLKGMSLPSYANCNSATVRNSSDCKRHCAR